MGTLLTTQLSQKLIRQDICDITRLVLSGWISCVEPCDKIYITKWNNIWVFFKVYPSYIQRS